MKEKEKWNETKSVFGLPKVKIIRFKIKKEKAAKAVESLEAGAATTAAQGEGAATAPAAKPAQAAKTTPQAKAADEKKETKK